jgi:salicylate hydroxylase
MDLNGLDVTVLGAGVAGLCVARALALRGAQVTVLEQADAIREVGAGIQISPNSAKVLHALGLGEALVAASLRAQAVELREAASGDLVTRLDVSVAQAADAYHFVHRADLIALLLEGARAAGVQIALLQKVAGIDLAGPRPVWQTEGGARGQATLLVGADGLHSGLRAALNGAGRPFFTGQVAWRAVVPEPPGAAPVAEVHMAPGRHLVSYPLRGGTMRNIVAVEERKAWVEEGWTLRDDTMDMKLAFAGFAPRVRDWLERVEDVWLWGLFRHPVAGVWQAVLPQGGAVILGDAAHPTLPFLAQGASMAIEDAWVLAACLASRPTHAEALVAYQAARQPRCTRIVAAANTNARLYHLGSPARQIAHLALRLGSVVAPTAPLRRFDWLYRHDVTTERS